MSFTLAACGAEKHGPGEEDSRSDSGTLDAQVAEDAGPVGDAEVSAADGGDVEVGLELVPQALRDAIVRAAEGGEVDLDADGVTDLSVTVESDRRVVKVLAGSKVQLLVTRFFDGTTEKSGDFNLDDVWDYSELELTTADGFSRQTTQDRNYDGTVHWPENFEIRGADGTTHALREWFDGATWQLEVEGTNDTGSIQAGAGDCSGEYPIQDDVHATDVEIVGHLRVVQCKHENAQGCTVDAPKGACTRAQVSRIQNQLTTLFHDGLDELKPVQEVGVQDSSVMECLRKRQAPFVEALINNLANGKGPKGVTSDGKKVTFSGSRVACGISCAADADLVLLGSTDVLEREQVNLNMEQDDGKLRDTLLHELIHSAGYDGPPGHHDAEGDQRDSVYACSRWCTGRSTKSPGADGSPQFDMNGMLDMDDCFKCSGTQATREECCGEKHTCSDGCCDQPCESNGKCKRDPCNPAQNNGDFSHCRFKGPSTLTATDGSGSSSGNVQWAFDAVDGNKVKLVPTGTAACGLTFDGCTAKPLSTTVSKTDGWLLLDYNKTPPTYQGTGITSWGIMVSCPGMPPTMVTVPFKSAWFAVDTARTFVSGGPLKGVVKVTDGELVWDYQPY